jgi:hypothetical protein
MCTFMSTLLHNLLRLQCALNFFVVFLNSAFYLAELITVSALQSTSDPRCYSELRNSNSSALDQNA